MTVYPLFYYNKGLKFSSRSEWILVYLGLLQAVVKTSDDFSV